MKAKKSLQNLISVFVTQAVTIVLGLVIPRLTILSYGSETNGFMSLISQIYVYVALLEAGLGTALVQALYAPITRNDKEEISGIISAAKKYYNKVAVLYTAVVIAISVVLPFVIDSQLTYWEISAFFLLFGVSNIINFCFTAAMRPILLAEGKNYVNNNITLVFHLFSQFAKILLLTLAVNIVVLQFCYSLINVLQIVVYYVYFKKKYSWIDKKAKPLFDRIKQRGAFLVQQVSRLFFSCVDIIIISFVCDLKAASIYAVYMLVFDSIGRIISMVLSSTQYILAQSYNACKEKYVSVHRGYESVLVAASFAIYSTAFVLTIPFIKLYTDGVSDVNYIDTVLPLLFTLIGLFTTFKMVPLCLINFTYHAKQTLNRTICEAAINFVLSFVLALVIGMRGVLLATCIALVYRVIDAMIYTNKKILGTSVFSSLKLYLGNLIAFGTVVLMHRYINIEFANYVDFIIYGFVVTILLLVYYFIINALLDIKQANYILNMLKKKLLKR